MLAGCIRDGAVFARGIADKLDSLGYRKQK